MQRQDCNGGVGEGLGDPVALDEFLASLMDEKKSACAAAAAAGDGDDDDDCVVLDGDPDQKAVVIAKEQRPGEDGPEEELQIVAEKGELACRDFPHPRHLCASLPFSTSSYVKHCAMCHCYVCDTLAPCAYWGKGNLLSDHCRATDKDGKWKKMRQSLKRKIPPPSNRANIRNFSHPSSTAASPLQYPGPHISVPLSVQPRSDVIQPSAIRVPVSSNVSQNQQMNPSMRVRQNVGQVVNLPKGPKVSHTRIKRARVAPPVSTNVNQLHPHVPNRVPVRRASSAVHPTAQFQRPASSAVLPAPQFQRPASSAVLPAPQFQRPASSAVFQTRQVAPMGYIATSTLQGFPPQNFLSAPTISQGRGVPPKSYVHGAPVTQLQLSRCSSLATQGQGTQCPQDSSTNIGQKSWQDVLATLASELGVPDYNIDQPLHQQSASTQPNQLLAQTRPNHVLSQVKATQGVEANRSHVAATSQMVPSNGHQLPNHNAGQGI